MIWFELLIDDEAKVNNHPERGREHWGCSFLFLDRPRQMNAGEMIMLEAEHDTTKVDLIFAE